MEATESTRNDGMGEFMCFMASRLLEIRPVLKSSGSFYFRCDSAASWRAASPRDCETGLYGYTAISIGNPTMHGADSIR